MRKKLLNYSPSPFLETLNKSRIELDKSIKSSGILEWENSCGSGNRWRWMQQQTTLLRSERAQCVLCI